MRAPPRARPPGARAAAAATGRNPIGVTVPCHRSVGADGSLTGYAGGLAVKRALLALDGQAGYGQVIGLEATDMAIVRAKQHGVCVMALANAHHLCRIGQWAELAVAQGLVSISFVNVISRPIVAPYGGADARFGTNPCTIGIPLAGQPPFILDMATSGVAQGKVRVAYNKGEKVPPGLLLDDRGNPTTDARYGVVEPFGALTAFGLHKGYGLALMVDVLSGVLPGAATGLQVYGDERRPDVGHFFLALDPAAFRPLDEFKRDMDRLARELKDTPKANGQPRIYVAGEKSFAKMAKYRTEGIPLGAKVVENLKQIGEELRVPWPGP